MCGHYSYGGLPGVVSVPSVEYDAAKVRLRLETSLGECWEAGHGKAKLSSPAHDNPHYGDSRDELCKRCQANASNNQFSPHTSDVADSCQRPSCGGTVVSNEALDRGIMQTVYDLHRAFD
jgi:hypothetical protein